MGVSLTLRSDFTSYLDLIVESDNIFVSINLYGYCFYCLITFISILPPMNGENTNRTQSQKLFVVKVVTKANPSLKVN